MPELNLNGRNDMKLLAEEVKTSLRGAKIIGIIHDRTEQGSPRLYHYGGMRSADKLNYWEAWYVIAWEREDQCGTHIGHVDAFGQSMLTTGHYDMDRGRALEDMLRRSNTPLLIARQPDEPETFVQLVISERDFKAENDGSEFTDADLVSFAKEANDVASHWNGYEGWRAKRGDRFVFDPDEIRTGY
jgi:hypothetical protein